MQRSLLALVLGILLSTNLFAQPIQVWQKNFGEAPGTTVGLSQLLQMRPNRLVGVGATFPPGNSAINKGTLWFFNGQGDTIRSRSHALKNGGYLSTLPSGSRDLLITGYADTTTSINSYNLALFYVRTDSSGNWRTQPRFLPTYGYAGGKTSLLPLPAGGALWSHMVYLYPYAPFPNQLYTTTAQVVRLDSAQRVIWQHQYGGASAGQAALATLLDGSYVLIGTKSRTFQPPTGGTPFSVSSGWVQHIKANGDTIQRPEFFGNIYEQYEPQDVQPTSDGGYIIAGTVYPDKYVPVFNCCPIPQGWLAKFDSLGVQQWEQRIQGRTLQAPGCRLTNLQILANGQLVVTGERGLSASTDPNKGYLAAYAPNGSSGASPVWEQYFQTNTGQQQSKLTANGDITLSGQIRVFRTVNGVTDLRTPGVLTRFVGIGSPYVPDYCRHLPVPNAGYSLNAGRDTLRLVDFSVAGPRYAQIERWRWHYSDGTFFDGPTPPPHHYATVPRPGETVTLTVTNNLGCSATQTLYPFGTVTAIQQSFELDTHTSLYPNPANSVTTLLVDGLPYYQVAKVEVSDMLGRVVLGPHILERSGLSAFTQLDVAMLPAGVYSVIVTTGQNRCIKRLLVHD